jgi:hypothetical protein
MTFINPSGIPWDEYLVMHARTITVTLVLVVILLCSLLFVEFPGGTTLTGTVTSKGKPVVFGTVTVLTADNRTFFVPIRADGTYTLKGLPTGVAKVAVSSPNPRPITQPQDVAMDAVRSGSHGQPSGSHRTPSGGGRTPGRPATSPGQREAIGGVSIAATSDRGPAVPGQERLDPQKEGWFRIPGRYASPATSGLGTEVVRGRTTLNLSLD